MIVPGYLFYYMYLGGAAIVVALVFGLRSALARAAWPEPDRTATVWIAAAVLAGWFLLAIALGGSGIYHSTTERLPTIQYGILLPILIGVALFWRSPAVRHVVAAVPLSWLVGVQFYRALGVIFLVQYAAGRLPGLFALPAGIGDIVVGLLAPVVALAYARAPRQSAGLMLLWNIIGILDLVVAVTTGSISAPSPFLQVATQPTSELMSVLPLVVVPTFAVPLSILLHLASLAKLRWEGERARADSLRQEPARPD